ncbi:uncharacterized protein METZ01_LOCUS96417 [marine metagenome]|uniref:Uncharacterized protein n=1 Tax=marine metagenome TaxID=408172 RepID=A0A381VVF6_9ZZZZ|tara:strand:+ start:40007 stop:40228 length:222 start_codon:yes stop_codon:yes gene_type:complete
MDDVHDKIIKNVIDYVKANELFQKKHSKKPKVAARRALGNLRILARTRRKQIKDEYEKSFKERKLLRTINNGK